jgi:hypothetical protein
MLGAARFEAGDAIGAASAFRRAVALQPGDARGWSRLGESLTRANGGEISGEAEVAFAEALRLAKRKRRIAMAGAIAASFVGSLLTLIGVLARHKGEDADEALSIDGTRSVVDTSRSRPLLILLVAVLFGMVALAASLSDL